MRCRHPICRQLSIMVDPPSFSCTVPRTASGSPAPLRSSHVLFGSGTAAQSVCLCTSWSSTRLSAVFLSASLSVWSVLLSYHSFLCFLLGRAEASADFVLPSDICAGWLLNATRPSRDHRVRDRHLCDPITERDCKDTMNKLCFANFFRKKCKKKCKEKCTTKFTFSHFHASLYLHFFI